MFTRISFILFTLFLATQQLVNNNDSFISDLLSKMSIEEKCGQMTQITLDALTNCPSNCSSTQQDGTPNLCTCPIIDDSKSPINQTKLLEAIKIYKVGSILNTAYDRAIKAEIWQQIISSIQDAALDTTLRIPVLYGLDSIHGANYIQEATLFPQPIGVASSFNIEIAKQIGAITAMETRAVGIPWNFYPVLDIGRQHLWPRLYETFGEDVYLASILGIASIVGSQGSGNLKNKTKVAACLKHYIGYSYPLNGRDRSASWIPDIILREYFLPSFAAGVKAGIKTAMINSGDVNGIPGHANSYYINEILKGELGFDGFTVSDWEDIIRLYTRDKMASTPEEAVRIAVMAGLDMSMVPFGFSFHDHCVNLSNKDANFLNRVNDAVSRILSVKNQIGLFDNLGKDSYPDPKLLKNVGTNYSWSFNLDAARECIILAKNQDILPLAKSGIKILITGTSGNSLRVLNGGWSYSWQGNREDLFKLFAQKSLTLLQAIQKKAISNVINYVEGANFTNVIDINDVLEQANQSDVIILCIGEDTYAEVLGNIDNLYLDRAQQQLADAVLSLGKDIIVVYLGGRPRIITSIVENENVKGVLLSLLPGNRGAEAIVDIIFGDYNPNARLPITWPRNANGQTPYDLRPLEMYAPNKYEYLYPFGFGLSYTKFNYSNLILSSTTVDYVSGVDVSVRVKNVGSCSGKEIVILYLEDVVASISRPIKQVKGVQKILLDSNEEITVHFQLTGYDFTFINRKSVRIAEDGLFVVYISNLNSTFTLINSPEPQ